MKIQSKQRSLNFCQQLIPLIGFDHFFMFYQTFCGYKRLPIVIYHSIGEEKLSKYNISLKKFEQQIEIIRDHCEFIPLKSIRDELQKNTQVNTQIKIALTFDDAFQNVFLNAHKILKKYNIPYTIFVPTGFIGKTSEWMTFAGKIMTAKELLELKNSDLVDFGSHTVYHENMADLSHQQMYNEIINSKIQLEKLLGEERIEMFAYPFGGLHDFSKRTSNALKENGYKIAVTTRHSVMNSFQQLLTLRRIQFSEDDNVQKILAKINGEYDWYLIKERLTFLFRKIFGINVR